MEDDCGSEFFIPFDNKVSDVEVYDDFQVPPPGGTSTGQGAHTATGQRLFGTAMRGRARDISVFKVSCSHGGPWQLRSKKCRQ